MAQKQFPHIFIKQPPEVTTYTSPKGGGKELKLPHRNRRQHGMFLNRQFKELWKQVEKEQKHGAISLPVKEGFYVEFKSKAGFDLITKSLENIRSDIRLLNIHEEELNTQKVTIATVYIPNNKVSIFLKKIEQYLNDNTTPTRKQLEKNARF